MTIEKKNMIRCTQYLTNEAKPYSLLPEFYYLF